MPENFKGKVEVQNDIGKTTLVLHPNSYSHIAVRDDDARPAIFLNGAMRFILLRDSSDRDTIKLDGATGDIVLSNADCAEDFDISESADVEPGTVVVIDDEDKLRQNSKPYDKRVAGVISGAGNNKPGILLDRKSSHGNRIPVGLMGKVYCKVDADYSPIEVGDMLTTSSTPGHAMKAEDPFRAFGAVIGKALKSIKSGKGLIPILIALQ